MDGQWIEERLAELADATRIDGEIWRAAYTPEDATAKGLVGGWMEAGGLAARQDTVGNLLGRLAATGDGAGVVMTGSHLDTVKNGGKYDGAAGVLTALAAAANLAAKHGPPKKTVEVVGFMEEEGSRYSFSYVGSKAISGVLSGGDLAFPDAGSIPLSEALRAAGHDPAYAFDAGRTDIDAFIELHIEQGPVLDEKGFDIGVVDGIVGFRQWMVRVMGKQNHAGTTPMAMRTDPVVAVSSLIGRVTGLCREASPTATLTVGQLQALPGMSNVIAGEVRFSIDARDTCAAALSAIEAGVEAAFETLRGAGFTVEADLVLVEPPVLLNEALVQTVEDAANALGLKYTHLNSGAGHDAQIMAARYPTAMIFVPSDGGVSHSPLEHTAPEDLDNGLRVLERVLYKLAWE